MINNNLGSLYLPTDEVKTLFKVLWMWLLNHITFLLCFSSIKGKKQKLMTTCDSIHSNSIHFTLEKNQLFDIFLFRTNFVFSQYYLFFYFIIIRWQISCCPILFRFFSFKTEFLRVSYRILLVRYFLHFCRFIK